MWFCTCAAQFSQHWTEAEQESLRTDARTRFLADLVKSQADKWGGRAANNVIWAHAVLGHGSPMLVEKACPAFLEDLRPCYMLPGLDVAASVCFK